MSSTAIVIRGTGERGPAGGRAHGGDGAGRRAGPAGMSSHSSRYTRMPEPPASARATKPTRHSSASMPLYSASPPETPPITLSVRLRRSCARTGGPGGGGGGRRCNGGGGGGAGAEREAVRKSWQRACRRRAAAIHQGSPHPTLVPAPLPSRVITRVGAGRRGATIVT